MYLNARELALLRKLRITLAEAEDGVSQNAYRGLAPVGQNSEETALARRLERDGFCLGNGANGWRLATHGFRALEMERLRDENERLLSVLEPFAMIWRRFKASGEDNFGLWLDSFMGAGLKLARDFEQAADVWNERESE